MGEAFLPGIILQVYSPNIKSFDLLGQHNNLLLNQSVTIIKQVNFETFNWVRSLQTSVNKYTAIVYKEVFDLNQVSQEGLVEYDTKQNQLGENIQQQLVNYRQVVLQELSQIRQAIQQAMIAGDDSRNSALLLQEKVNFSVEVIQEQLVNLRKIVPEEINCSGQTFKDLSKTIKQEMQEAISTIKQKLEKFLLK